MENFGKVARETRKSRRNLKLREFKNLDSSEATLSRFENKGSIRLDTFFKWTEIVGISAEEFFFAANGYKLTGYHDLLNKTADLREGNHKQGLKKLLSDTKWRIDYEKNVTFYDRMNYLMIKNIISNFLEEETLTTREKNKISEYLYSIEDWTNYELVLYGNTMQIFSTDEIIKLSNTVATRAARFQGVLKNKSKIAEILVNTVITLVTRKDYNNATYFRIQAEKNLDSQDSHNRLLLLFAEGTIDFYNNREMRGKEKMEYVVNAFTMIKSFGYADIYQKYYDEVTKNSENH